MFRCALAELKKTIIIRSLQCDEERRFRESEKKNRFCGSEEKRNQPISRQGKRISKFENDSTKCRGRSYQSGITRITQSPDFVHSLAVISRGDALCVGVLGGINRK